MKLEIISVIIFEKHKQFQHLKLGFLNGEEIKYEYQIKGHDNL